jgi:phage portal protein BeeE
MPSLIGKALALRSQGGPPVPMGGGGMHMLPSQGMGGNTDLTLMRAFKTNGTTFANVSLLASAAAGPGWKLFRTAPQDGRVRYTTSDKGSDQRTEVIQHAALNALNTPAAITVGSIRLPVWTRFALFEISGIWLETTGKSYWVVDRAAAGNASVPLGLWPVRPDRMVAVPDRSNYLAGYIYTSPDGKEKIPLLPTDVVFNRYPDPEDPYSGCGPIHSVLTDIEAAKYAGEWNKNYFLNSAEPGGVIQLDHSLEDGEFDSLVDQWRETHRGVARAHRIAVLEGGATWVPNTRNLKDMDFANLRSVMRDTIREALGMHKVMTGVTDDVNRANAQTGEEVFASWKVSPRLDRWRDVLNSQFLPLFGAAGDGVEFDYIYPMPQNREQDALELSTKSKAAQVLVDAGYDPDDVCEVVGLPKMKVAIRASQTAALPPAWVAAVPDAPGGGSAPAGGDGASVPDPEAGPGADTENALRRAAGWESPAWRHLAGPPARRRVPAVPPLLNKEAAAKAFEQQAQDYPPHAMAWMHHAQWMGPVKVPIDHIDPVMKWMDGADPDHVQEFVERRQAGKKLKPVILVKTPGNDKLLLVDGHHRYLAEAELDEPVRAFIGTVDADEGEWTEMHKYQLKPSTGPGAAMGRRMAAWNRLAGAR